MLFLSFQEDIASNVLSAIQTLLQNVRSGENIDEEAAAAVEELDPKNIKVRRIQT